MKNPEYHTFLFDAWVNAFNAKFSGSSLKHNYDREIDTHVVVVDAKNWRSVKKQKLFDSVHREAGLKFQVNVQFIPKGTKPNLVKAIRRVNKTNVANERMRRIKQNV